MPNAIFGAIILGVVAVAFVLYGILQLGACGSGPALVSFGIAVLAAGAAVSLFGGFPYLGAFAIVALILVGAGWWFTSAAGCTFTI